jgi:hypothetical protein
MTAPGPALLFRYAAFGHGLASSIPFPELREAPGLPVRWKFSTTAALPDASNERAIGSEVIYAAVEARLSAHDGGHRIEVDDTGRFDIAKDRCHLTWESRAGAWPDFVRAHLLGRVLATTLYLDGLLPLHASAVSARDGGVAFLAPKGFGKSSLALAAVRAGARLATDDTLPVLLGAPVTAWPGIQSLRVHDDVVSALGAEAPGAETREGKRLLTSLDPAQLLDAPAPLAAIYLLAPIDDDDLPPVEYETLPTPIAAMAIVSHVKIARMLGAAASATMLERAAAIARTVPVRLLQTPRDLARLDEVARTVLGWHGGAS